MKKILILAGVLFLIVFILIFGFKRELNIHLKNTFFSTAIMVTDNFERDLILSKYNISNELKYITLRDLNYLLNEENIDVDNSYIAFSDDNYSTFMYITLIGKGKYKGLSYLNLYKKDLSTQNIIIDKEHKLLEENTKEIKALKYKEEI